eukprot:5627829-Prymnesium_polylepis.1
MDVCCDECSHVENCSAFTINGTVCELHNSTSVIPSANMMSGIIKASPPPPPPSPDCSTHGVPGASAPACACYGQGWSCSGGDDC